MKNRSILRACAVLVAFTGLVSAAPNPATAQGSVSLPPAIQAKINAWFKWMSVHKDVIRLGDLLVQVGQMDKDPRTQLNKKQSGQMLAIIHKWESKPSMSEEDAKTVQKEIGGILTLKQVQKVATIPAPSQQMMKGGGGSAPKAGKMNAKMIPDPPAKPWNPLNPDSMPIPQVRTQMKAVFNSWEASLTKRAKG